VDLGHACLAQLSLGQTYGERGRISSSQPPARDLEQSLLESEQLVTCLDSLSGHQRPMEGGVDIAVDFPSPFIEFGAQAVPGTIGGFHPEPPLPCNLETLAQRRTQVQVRSVPGKPGTRTD
jgi:hypothetical protein